MQNLLVSIIIPVYNVENYVIECLESIKNQQLNNCEIIIINDGSTDNSERKIQEYISKFHLHNFKYYYKQNGGLSSARNYGITKSSGEYIWFIDSDDLITKDIMQYFQKIIYQYKPDIIRSRYLEFTNDCPPLYDSASYIIYNNGFEYVKDCIKEKKYYIVVCTSLIKKEIFSKYSLSFIDGIYFEDQMFTVQMLLNEDLTIVDSNKISYLYRQNISSISNTFSLKKAIDMLWVIERLYDILREKCENTIYQEMDFWALPGYAFSYLTVIYNNLCFADKKIIKKKLSKEIKRRILKTNSHRFQTDFQNKLFLFSPLILKVILKIHRSLK